MSDTDLPAFEVKDYSGKHYRIWADGRIDGFENMKPRIVINRIPLFEGLAINEALKGVGK